MRDLKVMTRHGLVHGQVLQHVVVVLAVERLAAFLAPVSRRGRDGVEGLAVTLERPGRVAVCDRHASLKLRHHDDLDRLVGQADEAPLAHEARDFLEIRPGLLDDRRVRRPVLGQCIQHGPNRLIVPSFCRMAVSV